MKAGGSRVPAQLGLNKRDVVSFKKKSLAFSHINTVAFQESAKWKPTIRNVAGEKNLSSPANDTNYMQL